MDDSSTEDLEESMIDVIERAEAFLNAHSALERQHQRNSTLSHSTSDIFEHSDTNVSFITADGESSSSDSASSSSRHTLDDSQSLTSSSRRSLSRAESLPLSDEISIASDVESSQLLEPADSDCIVVHMEPPRPVVATIDLCSPSSNYQSHSLLRRLQNAPIVESITLDDSVLDPPPAQAVPPSGSTNARKRTAAHLDCSQSSESPAVTMNCPICLDSIFKQRASSTICGHLFCYSCISQAIQMSRQCPICKRKLTRSQIHPIYLN